MKPLDADQQRAVLDGAMQLFAQYKLDDISLDKLSKLTGVPAFHIVRHYHSSENILKAVLERELELMAAAAQEPELRMPGETLGDELHVLAGVISSFRAGSYSVSFSAFEKSATSCATKWTWKQPQHLFWLR
jgi:AcrR family transcriptional regulator